MVSVSERLSERDDLIVALINPSVYISSHLFLKTFWFLHIDLLGSFIIIFHLTMCTTLFEDSTLVYNITGRLKEKNKDKQANVSQKGNISLQNKKTQVKCLPFI